jgi:hypothetical protein
MARLITYWTPYTSGESKAELFTSTWAIQKAMTVRKSRAHLTPKALYAFRIQLLLLT